MDTTRWIESSNDDADDSGNARAPGPLLSAPFPVWGMAPTFGSSTGPAVSAQLDPQPPSPQTNAAPVIGSANTEAPVIQFTQVSVGSSGAQGNGSSSYCDLSPDGTRVLFESDATNLVAGDTNGVSDLFIKDLTTGAVTRISTDASGAEGSNYSIGGSFSPDGTKVVFDSAATNLVPGGTDGSNNVFVKDLVTGTVTIVSTDSSGHTVQGGGANGSFSPDGTKVLFNSQFQGLVPGDTNGKYDVFIKDLNTGSTTRVSTTPSGGEANGDSLAGTFSPDGTKIAFGSGATNLGGVGGLYVKDLNTGAIVSVNTSAAGVAGNATALQYVFSSDGTKMLFASIASNLVPGDTNNNEDIFLKDLTTGAIARVSTNAAGAQANDGSDYPTFSPDGTKILFHSRATNLVPGVTATGQLYEKDLLTGGVSVVSQSPLGIGNGSSIPGAFFPDGSQIAITSGATNLAFGDVSRGPFDGDVFLASRGYFEGAAPAVVAAGLSVTDSDSATFVGAAVTISTGLLAGDELKINGTTSGTIHNGGNTIAYAFAAGTMTLSGADTVADYQSALRLVTFDSTSSDPTAGGTDHSRVISWQVNDGSDPSNTATTTIQVVGVDHHPVGTAGDDAFYFGPAFQPGDTVDGGAGSNDQIGLSGDYSSGLTFGPASMTGIEVVACLPGYSYNLTTVDQNVAPGATLSIYAVNLAAGNTLTFNGSAETDGKFVVYGGAGNDVLQGGAGDDTFWGLGGADTITGNGGADIFAYFAVSQSTGNASGTAYDTIVNFESSDVFDLPAAVSAIDPLVTGHALSSASFDTDLASAIGGAQLAVGHAVLFEPDSGTLAGHDFIIVDANGVAGYQSGADYVIEVTSGAPISLSTANFV